MLRLDVLALLSLLVLVLALGQNDIEEVAEIQADVVCHLFNCSCGHRRSLTLVSETLTERDTHHV